MIPVLFVALAVVTAGFVAVWIFEVRRHRDTPDPGTPDAERVAVGFFANFFDALGIGSFATSTTYFRLRKLVRDELIPGSLNVGYTLPTTTQAVIGIAVIAVDPSTLVLFIATAVAGAWVGASVVSHMPRRGIQIGMGIALLVAAGFMLAKITRIMPSDEVRVGPREAVVREAESADSRGLATLPAGTPLTLGRAGRQWSLVETQGSPANAPRIEGYIETSAATGIVLGVTGLKLAVGLTGSFFLGTIMPLGIGYYAPCMVLIALLGMSPSSAFPIMMGACAFLMPVASVQFVRKRRYSLRTTIGMAIGGVFGSALALLVVKSLNLYYVMWLVTIVIVYTGISLLRTAAAERRAAIPIP